MGMDSVELERAKRKLSETLTSGILEAGKRAIRKNNPNKSVCSVVAKEPARLLKGRSGIFPDIRRQVMLQRWDISKPNPER